MARFKATPEGDVPFTAAEEAAADLWEAQALIEQAETLAQAYKNQRQLEYPPIGDQLDALFRAGVFPADMAAILQAVKDKYPKG
jgi:hypothetical protein